MIKLQNLIREVENDHSNDRDMITGVAEIIRMVNDTKNRIDIAFRMLKKFERENVKVNKKEFLKMCNCINHG